jgi:hypothetical protein
MFQTSRFELGNRAMDDLGFGEMKAMPVSIMMVLLLQRGG